MQGHQVEIEAAYLTHCSADAAYGWRRNRQPKTDTRRPSVDIEESRAVLEYLLLHRRDPLIDLGLARFAENHLVLGRVYVRGNIRVRCAARANAMAALDKS